MADYFVLGHSASGSSITDGKKLAVRFDTLDAGLDTPAEIPDGTLDNDTVISIGVSKKVWGFDAVVPVTAATGWASKSDVDGWMADNTAANQLWKLQDMADSTVYDVVMTNREAYRPKPLNFQPYSATGVWLIHFEFKQQ